MPCVPMRCEAGLQSTKAMPRVLGEGSSPSALPTREAWIMSSELRTSRRTFTRGRAKFSCLGSNRLQRPAERQRAGPR
jgi:hypothetical protein